MTLYENTPYSIPSFPFLSSGGTIVNKASFFKKNVLWLHFMIT